MLSVVIARLRAYGVSLVTCAVAAGLAVIAGGAHANVLPAYPQGSLEEERSIESASRRVMLSAIREVGNEVRAERSTRLAVAGTGQLYLMETGVGRQEARRWYLDQLQARDARILFRCEGRECGRSNVWANQVFDQSTLYGRDSEQDYLVAGLEDENGQRWLVLLYTITRGSQRDYVWLEQLKIADNAVVPGFSGSGGRITGPLVVPWEGDISIRLDWNVEVRRLVRDRARDPDTRIVIVGFSSLRPEETLEQAVERSQRAAETLSALLDRSGVPASRHILRAIGPMVRATSPARPANRIELLIVAPPGEGSNNE